MKIKFNANIDPDELDYYNVTDDDYRMGAAFFYMFNYETGSSIDFAVSKKHIIAFQGSDGGFGSDFEGNPVFTQIYSSAVKIADYTAGDKVKLRAVVNRSDDRFEWLLMIS